MTIESLGIQQYREALQTAFTGRANQLTSIFTIVTGTGHVFVHKFLPNVLASPVNVDDTIPVMGKSDTVTRRIDVKAFVLGAFITRDLLDNNGPQIATALQSKFMTDMNLTIDRLMAVSGLGSGDFLNSPLKSSDSDYSTQRLVRLKNNTIRIPDYRCGVLTEELSNEQGLLRYPEFTRVSISGSLNVINIIELKIRLIEAVKVSNRFSMFLMMNPTDIGNLYKSSTLSNRIQFSQDAEARTGYREMLLGFTIIPNIYLPVGKALCFTSNAFAIVLNPPVTNMDSSILRANGISLGIYVNMGIGIIREEESIIVDLT